MAQSSFVVLDTSALFPAALRDVLLRAAERELYRPLWSEEILEELRRNLMKDLGKRQEQVLHLTDTMVAAFPEATVDGYQPLSVHMGNHPKDRHVLAVAVKEGANTIVTANAKHFPGRVLKPYGIQALSPDDFLLNLLNRDGDHILQILAEQASQLSRPSRSAQEVLAKIAKDAPRFASACVL